MSEKNILLLGGGGHCRSVLDCLLSMGIYDKIGIIDNDHSISIFGIGVVGSDDDLIDLISNGWKEAFITVGSIETTDIRRKLYSLINETGFIIPTIIDPSATVAGGTIIKKGTFIGKRAVINSGSIIGCCSIINTGSIVEHDCHIGDFSHISSGTILCGEVKVGSDSHIGAGSVVRQSIAIGNNTLIGIGSVVVKNIPDNVKAYGNPCKVIK